MRSSSFSLIVMASALALAGCGGGGGYVASTPPAPVTPTPSPTPTPTPTSALSIAIIPGATTSQQFAVMGVNHGDAVGQPALMEASDQLQVRYLASSNSYEVKLPGGQAWTTVSSNLRIGSVRGGLWQRMRHREPLAQIIG